MKPSSLVKLAAATGAGTVVTVAAAEWLHWTASRRYFGAGPGRAAGSEAVIVLGYPARRGGRPHPLQRWRCQIAARSIDPRRDGQVIFTGAGPAGQPSEAAVMAGYARDALGIPADRIALETRSRSTRENIEFTLPMIEASDSIKITSDPMHSARARRYLRNQRPDLAARVCPAADYRFGDHRSLKVATAAYELSRRAWQSARSRIAGQA